MSVLFEQLLAGFSLVVSSNACRPIDRPARGAEAPGDRTDKPYVTDNTRRWLRCK
jgi:hypothetical protein